MALPPPPTATLDQLRLMTAGTLDPTLSDDELTDALNRNTQPDPDGLEPAETDWVPTYAMGAAAQDGWLLKAAKVAHRVTARDGSLSLNRSDLHAHCMAMAEAYGRRRLGAVVIAGTKGTEEREVLPALNGPNYYPPPDPWVPGGAR